MAIWKQLALTILLAMAALWGAAVYVPGAAAAMRANGMGPVLDRLGVAPAAEPERPAQAAGGGRPQGGGAVVRAEPPGEGRLSDSIESIGDGRALRSVTVFPQAPGRVAEVLVQSGQRVSAGDVMVRLDREAEEIALARARLVLEDAQSRVERLRQLAASGATTEVQIREAELALRQAELALDQAGFDLRQRTILAPIDGWLGILSIETGAQVSAATEIAQIDDRSALLVDFRLPERIVGRIAAGDSLMAAPLSPGLDPVQGHVSAVDNRVDQASRTLRIQARLDNTDDRLRAGMAFAIRFDLPGEPAASVDPLAVQWSREGAYIWVVRAERATRLPVRILQRTADAVMVAAEFAPGDLVIVEGLQLVRPNAPVTLRGDS